MSSSVFKQHDHKHCIQEALDQAVLLCEQRGVRLTAIRKQVLELIWQNHKPLGAYDLLDMLSSDQQRVAPPTVYRALDFLQENNLIHRINSLNAFIGCCSPEHGHEGVFLICQQCGMTQEIESPQVAMAIEQHANKNQFKVSAQTVEVTGICPNCRD